MSKWFDVPPREGSRIIYSRVRLARNWKEYPFPGKLSKEKAEELTGRLMEGLKGLDAADGMDYRFYNLAEMTELEKSALVERRALNRNVVKKQQPAGLVLSGDERTGVIINGDDHIKIQSISEGLDLRGCYERADRIDDFVSGRFEYAFDDKYGYLTSFPTNVGTGLRASVVLHLPILSARRDFNNLIADMGRFGTVIRGVYGDTGDNPGSLYRVSNQRTLGQTEEGLIEIVERTAVELNEQEGRLRAKSKERFALQREDESYKAYGLLKYSRRIARKDAMNFLSLVMAGVSDGILKFKEPCSIYGLILGVQSANLLSMSDKPLNKDELDAARADFLRARLPDLAG